MGTHPHDESVLSIPKILGEELHLAAFYPQLRSSWVRQDFHEHANEALS